MVGKSWYVYNSAVMFGVSAVGDFVVVGTIVDTRLCLVFIYEVHHSVSK